jgi:hypothetical protein
MMLLGGSLHWGYRADLWRTASLGSVHDQLSELGCRTRLMFNHWVTDTSMKRSESEAYYIK